MSEQGIARGAGRLRMTPDAYRAHIDAGERWCSFHKDWHPQEAFNICTTKTDGVQNFCRDGNRVYQRQWNSRKRASAQHGAGLERGGGD